jgi:hypothetical protein
MCLSLHRPIHHFDRIGGMASATRPELSSRLIHRNANVDETDNFRLTDYTGIIMVTFGQSGSPINIVALGVAASATLVVLYVMCAVVAMVAPGLSLAHGWLTLFSTAPAGRYVIRRRSGLECRVGLGDRDRSGLHLQPASLSSHRTTFNAHLHGDAHDDRSADDRGPSRVAMRCIVLCRGPVRHAQRRRYSTIAHWCACRRTQACRSP